MSLPESRFVCRRCGRALCVCAALPADGGVATSTSFLVIQSRAERRNALSTGRLVALGLANAALLPDDGTECVPRPAWLPPNAALLFPGTGSVELRAPSPPDQEPFEPPLVLVVIDGTWHEAGRLVRNNAWLAELPRLCLPPGGAPSSYRVRTQPAAHCVSTVECVARVLRIVEGGDSGAGAEAATRLLASFDLLVEHQLASIATRAGPGTHRSHATRRRMSVGRALRRRGIVVDAAPPGAAPPSCGVHVVVTASRWKDGRLRGWHALRLVTGDVFSWAHPSLFASNDGGNEAAVCADRSAAWAAWLRPHERAAS